MTEKERRQLESFLIEFTEREDGWDFDLEDPQFEGTEHEGEFSWLVSSCPELPGAVWVRAKCGFLEEWLRADSIDEVTKTMSLLSSEIKHQIRDAERWGND